MQRIKHSSAETIKKFIVDILNGTSLGIVLTLIPSALVSQLLLLFAGNAIASKVAFMTTLIQSTLPLVSGFAVGQILKLTVIDSGAIALAMFVSSGVVKSTSNSGDMVIAGSGIILNILLVAFLATILVKLTERSFGHFKILLQPLVVTVIAGGIGLSTLNPISTVQMWIGDAVSYATNWTPVLMGAVLGAAFAFLIVSPLSSVGIAMAIGLTGIGSGAANAGITVASFTLALMGAKVNPIGGTLAHFIGSPKIQMANMLLKPKLFIPTTLAASTMGAIATLFKIKGTPFSAGFGFSGLIGPLTAYTESDKASITVVFIILVFVIFPILLAMMMKWLFMTKLKMIRAEDLKLTLQ
ncbi:membrane protein [Leuconostoc litchii]|uniref:PTS sugar transporter subunit IIC n=1 Tax=Leuconostoc litchii TaxID=1981069 RepID=A0A6P2CLR6_9LACO|nr:PTS sugar transporter subunit IIC [Leuconostoc litchii]TYC46397.1 PTS sugar transporter subunit IIC [Leuconostoc litchii]GMA70132.1 membrane protein [Leuconostoc litchii]